MAPDPETLWRALRNNRGFKLAAVVLAIITWYTVRELTSNTNVIQDVRIEVLTDPGWAVLDRSVDEVDVLFRGSLSDIRFLNRDQVRVEIDLRNRSRTGSRDVRLSASNVRAPGSARVVSVDPPEITLVLDRQGEKPVRVQADVVGNPPEGFEVEAVTCIPPEVVMQAPQGRLAGVEAVSTVPIDLEGRLRSFSLTRTLQAPSETWTASMSPDRVRVDVTIAERSARREIAGVPVRLLVAPNTPPIALEPETNVLLVVKGRANLIGALSASNLNAYVDCSTLQPGESRELDVHVPVPTGAEIVSVEPSRVHVEMATP